MGLCDLPGVETGCDAVGGAVGGAASAAAQAFVDAFVDGFAKLVVTMTTFWVEVPTPAIRGSGGPVAQVQGSVYWLQGFVLVGSLLYVAGKMALTRSGRVAGEAAVGLGTMVLTVGAGVAAIDILAVAGDRWASWIIDRSTSGDLTTRLSALTGGSAQMAVLGMGLEFVIALLGIISCIVQIFFLVARVGVLTVLAGTLPLAAAALATPAGKAWFKRSLGWIVAFLLYKPVAALIYASAFALTGNAGDLLSVLSGLMLIVLSVFALPALMRLAVPMVAAATGGGGGELASAAAGVALASGARRIAHNTSSGSSGGSGPGRLHGASGPSSSGGPGGGGSGGQPAGPDGAASTGGTPAAGASGPAQAGGAAGAAAGAGALAGGVMGAQAVRSGAHKAASSSTGEQA